MTRERRAWHPASVVRFRLWKKPLVKEPSSGSEARSCFIAPCGARARPDVCSTDICSLRLLALQSEHPRLDLLSIDQMDEWYQVHAWPSASVGFTRLWRSAREGSARTRRFLPRSLGFNRTSDASSQPRARPGFHTRSRLGTAKIAST